MRRQYLKKKLDYVRIHRVVSIRDKNESTVLQGLSRPYDIGGVPEGFYCPCEDGILLPRRRRGEKFAVAYTVMHEKML